MKQSKRAGKAGAALAVNIVLILLTALLLSLFTSYRHYTLQVNGNWTSTKVGLDKGVWGAWATMLTKPALHMNRLNLSCWHGMQEFVYKEPLVVKELRFDFINSGHSFTFFLNKTDTVSTGIVFQPHRTDSCRLFTSDSGGRFITTQSFPLKGAINAYGDNTVKVLLAKGALKLFINDKVIISGTSFSEVKVRPGFRGNLESLAISADNIQALDINDRIVIDEQFAPPRSISLWGIAYLAVAFVLLFLFYNRQLYAVTFLNICILIIAGSLYLVSFYWLSGLYPSGSGRVDWEEIKGNIEKPEEVVARLKTGYPLQKYAGSGQVILFIGSSQTWGAGASHINKTFPARVQMALDTIMANSPFTVINCGISGGTTQSLLSFYKNEWVKYRPVLTVINLAYNDGDTTVYRKNIREFISYNKAQKIETLLIEEPSGGEVQGLKPMHAILREEASLGSVPCIAMQHTMESCQHEGFLWWDDVHLTDFGQMKFAEIITPPIIELLIQKDPSLHSEP